MTSRLAGEREDEERRELLESTFALARRLGVRTLLVHAHTVREVRMVERLRERERIVWVARRPRRSPAGRRGDATIAIPETALSRLSQLNLTVFLAALHRHIDIDERVLVLSGVSGSRRLDTLVVVKPERDFPWLKQHRLDTSSSSHIARLLEIALRLAHEGREGAPIGTIFILGDRAALDRYLRQLILNPLKGHPRRVRSIHHPEFLETVRELTALDGAFIVDERGVVESAGTYLDAPLRGRRLKPGFGARHAAALALTTVTDAMALVISGSSGMVSVYEGGTVLLELEQVQHRF